MKSAHQNDLKTLKHIHLKCNFFFQISANRNRNRNAKQGLQALRETLLEELKQKLKKKKLVFALYFYSLK